MEKVTPVVESSAMLGIDGISLNRREKADGFNTFFFFINIGFSLAKNFNDSGETPADLITPEFSSLCNFESPTAEEINSIIMKLKVSADRHD